MYPESPVQDQSQDSADAQHTEGMKAKPDILSLLPQLTFIQNSNHRYSSRRQEDMGKQKHSNIGYAERQI